VSDIAALEKHACPACGAQAEWNPAKLMLACSFCGTQSPYRVDSDTGKIVELDLVRTLRDLPDEDRGWQADRRAVQCQSCKAVMVFDPKRVGQNCEFCGSPSLLDYQEIKAPIRPQSLLPFKVSETGVRETIRRWLAGRWFAPGALKKRALVDTIRGLYIPYWTFDARADCPWEAEAGHYYYVQEQYTDSQGKRQTRQVRHVRWEPAAGRVEHFFDDVPVPGTRGIDAGLIRGVEPFPTDQLVPYDTGYLSGFVVEHYQVVLLEAAQKSQQEMEQALTSMCAAQIPGDTYRNLSIHPVYSDRTFKHILVPVWLLVYTYGAKPFQVVINGYTGKMAGHYPKSAWKIALLVLSILAAVGTAIALWQVYGS
jgi:hypothetical protein